MAPLGNAVVRLLPIAKVGPVFIALGSGTGFVSSMIYYVIFHGAYTLAIQKPKLQLRGLAKFNCVVQGFKH